MKITKVPFKSSIQTWNAIYLDNNGLSPYMDSDFMNIYKKTMWVGRKRWSKKLVIYLCELSSRKIVICPILEGKDDAYIGGDLCASGYLDFLYPSNMDNKDFTEMFILLQQKLKGKVLHLNKLNEKSKLQQFLAQNYDQIGERQICVNISLPETIDQYYHSLSKSVRQNYRTSINRMARENKEWRIEVAIGKKVDSKLQYEQMQIYFKREAERLKKKLSTIQKFVKGNLNPITQAVKALHNNINGCLFIDGNVAGFLAGVITGDGGWRLFRI